MVNALSWVEARNGATLPVRRLATTPHGVGREVWDALSPAGFLGAVPQRSPLVGPDDLALLMEPAFDVDRWLCRVGSRRLVCCGETVRPSMPR